MKFAGKDFLHDRWILFHDRSCFIESCIETTMIPSRIRLPDMKTRYAFSCQNPDTAYITAVIDGKDDGDLALCTESEISSHMLPDTLIHPGHIPNGPRPVYHDTIALHGSNHRSHGVVRNRGHSPGYIRAAKVFAYSSSLEGTHDGSGRESLNAGIPPFH